MYLTHIIRRIPHLRVKRTPLRVVNERNELPAVHFIERRKTSIPPANPYSRVIPSTSLSSSKLCVARNSSPTFVHVPNFPCIKVYLSSSTRWRSSRDYDGVRCVITRLFPHRSTHATTHLYNSVIPLSRSPMRVKLRQAHQGRNRPSSPRSTPSLRSISHLVTARHP